MESTARTRQARRTSVERSKADLPAGRRLSRQAGKRSAPGQVRRVDDVGRSGVHLRQRAALAELAENVAEKIFDEIVSRVR